METHEKQPELEEEIIDIEEYSRQGKEVLVGKRYRLRIDKQTYIVDKHKLTGKEILGIAEKDPKTHILYQHFGGGDQKVIAAHDHVDLTAPGVERFTTMKRANTEG